MPENPSEQSDAVPAWRSRRADRFFLADRDVGWLTGSASLAATQMSAGTFVGTVGIHYAVGVSFFAIWPGIWLGWLVSLLFVAPHLRESGSVTVPDYLAARFDGDGAGGDRTRAIVGSIVAVVYLVYTAAQYVAGAVVLDVLLGVPQVWGTVSLAALAVGYTAVGGMRASVLTDAVQVVLMVGGAVAGVAVGLVRVGGLRTLLRRVEAVDAGLLGWGMPVTDVVGFALAFGLGIVVAPYEMNRVYAMSDGGAVRRAIAGSVAIQAVVAVSVVVLGLLARVTLPGLASPDAAVAELASALLGPVGGTLLLVGVLAAVLSTIDSVLLVSASAIAYDLYAGVVRPPGGVDALRLVGSDDVVVVARTATILAAVIPLGLAVRPGPLGGFVQLIVALYSALVGGTLFAPVLLGLYWRSATTAGATGGVVTGGVAVVAWHLLTDAGTALGPPLSALPPVLVGVVVSAATVVALSVGPVSRAG